MLQVKKSASMCKLFRITDSSLCDRIVNSMNPHTRLSSCLCLIMLLLLSRPGFAALPVPGHWPELISTSILKVQKKDIGANGAARAARKATGGRVLTVKKTRTGDSKGAYKVKVLLKGGRMRVLQVDAANGALR